MIPEWAPTQGCTGCPDLLRWTDGWDSADLKVRVEIQLAQGLPADSADLVCPVCLARYSPAGVIAERLYQDPSDELAAARHARYRERMDGKLPRRKKGKHDG